MSKGCLRRWKAELNITNGILGLEIILLVYQNIYVEISLIINNAAKSYSSKSYSLSVMHNYFDRSTKLLSDLYPANLIKFLNILQ